MSKHMLARGDAVRLPLGDRSVDLVIGSPPYLAARLYLENGKDLGIARDCESWIAWMLQVTKESLRVSRGAVIWVVASSTINRCYQPAPEGLLYRWWQESGSLYRPVIWKRNGIPGSGGDQWFRGDTEYCLCFKRDGKLPWSDNTSCGKPPKHRPGGKVSHRLKDGSRAYEKGTVWRQPAISNPGNLLDTGATGGGHLGHPLAHENEAPYPVEVPDFFIRSLCPPGGVVLDPFSGSATTVDAANRAGRNGIGLDLRQSQCLLGTKRIENPIQVKSSRPRTLMEIFENE